MTGTKRKHKGETLQDILDRPWCYYCERDFDDVNVLIQHQKAKHYKCENCGKRMDTASGLQTHSTQVHKKVLDKVENVEVPGRDGFDTPVYGMLGIPEQIMSAHIQRVTAAYFKAEAEHRAKTGNPPPGTVTGQQGAKKAKVMETKEELKARLAAHKAQRKAAKEAGLTSNSGDNTPGSTQALQNHQEMHTENAINGSNMYFPAHAGVHHAQPLGSMPGGYGPPALTLQQKVPGLTASSGTVPSTSLPAPLPTPSGLPPYTLPANGIPPYAQVQPHQMPVGIGYGHGGPLPFSQSPVGPVGAQSTSPFNMPPWQSNWPPPMPNYPPPHAQPTDRSQQPTFSPPSLAIDPETKRKLSTRINPALPQRPSFDTPTLSKEDMAKLHSSSATPVRATPVMSQPVTETQPQTVDELIADCRDEVYLRGSSVPEPAKQSRRARTTTLKPLSTAETTKRVLQLLKPSLAFARRFGETTYQKRCEQYIKARKPDWPQTQSTGVLGAEMAAKKTLAARTNEATPEPVERPSAVGMGKAEKPVLRKKDGVLFWPGPLESPEECMTGILRSAR